MNNKGKGRLYSLKIYFIMLFMVASALSPVGIILAGANIKYSSIGIIGYIPMAICAIYLILDEKGSRKGT